MKCFCYKLQSSKVDDVFKKKSQIFSFHTTVLLLNAHYTFTVYMTNIKFNSLFYMVYNTRVKVYNED